MLFVFSAFFIMLGLFFRHKRLSVAIWIYMFLLFAFNTSNADYDNYMVKFNLSVNSLNYIDKDTEFGFYLLSRIIAFFGGSYKTLLICVALCGLGIIYYIINVYVKNVTFPLILYFIFPFFLDVVQIRSFMAMVIFLCGCNCLLKQRKNRSITYILFLLLAVSIHYSSIFWLPIIFIQKKNIREILSLFIPILFIGCLLTYSGLATNLIMLIAPSYKASKWFLNTTNLGWVLYLYIHIAVVFFSYCSCLIYKQNLKLNNISDQLDFVECCLKINVIMSYIAVFYAYSTAFFRVYRGIFILNYIMFEIVLNSFKAHSKKYYGYLISGIMGIFTINFLNLGPSVARTLIPVLTENSFFFH